jgi:DNA repair photolyase
MELSFRPVKSVMTKTKVPGADFAVNPYTGCPFKCRYCYASFMRRFAHVSAGWGDFLIVKECPPIKNPQAYAGKTITFGTVCDPYNPFEARFMATRNILEQFVGVDVAITVLTKSNLVLRDIDLLKQLSNVMVVFSINTLDEDFRIAMESAPPTKERINAMRALHDSSIKTATFISPVFPEITDVPEIVEATRDFCDCYWLENLKLQPAFKYDILAFIARKYPDLVRLYDAIYNKGDKRYWYSLSGSLTRYFATNKLIWINYFFHEQNKHLGGSD